VDNNGDTQVDEGFPNTDGDTNADCVDADDDNDGFSDAVEAGSPLCAGNANNDGPPPPTNPLNDDTVINDGCPAVGPAEIACDDAVDDDGDGAFNDGCPQVGTFSEAQFKIGTGSLDQCGNTGWPLDLVSTGFSANKFDTVDLASFVAPVRRLGKNAGQTGFSSRWDLVPGNSDLTDSGWINIVDMAATVSGASGFPPMLGGVKAMNQFCPSAP
jgi:hypothetical protein